MLRTIIEKEIRDIIGSSKFAITFGACAVLILLAFYMGAKNYELNRTRYEAARAENIRQLEGLTDWLAVPQHRIFLPPQPLTAIVTGVSNDIGRTIEMHGRGELTPGDNRYSDDLIFAVFRFLDLDFIFGFVLSLFAILLGYNAISGEKEQGTLRLSFANALPRGKYILGKLIGSYTALSLPLILAISLGLLILIVLKVPMSAEDWLKLLLISLTGLLYTGAFLTLSIFVSALTRRSSNSFLLLLVIWILGAFIVPRASVLLAGRAVEVPSIDEIAAQKASLSSQLWEEDKKKMSNFKPSVSDCSEGTVNEFNRFMENMAEERELRMREFGDRLDEDRRNKEIRRRKLSLALARFSPSAAMTLAATSLAGSSVELKDRFRSEAYAYQQTYGKFMTEKTGLNPGSGMVLMRMKMGDEEPEPIDPGELPEFEFTPITLSSSFEAALFDIELLAVYNLVFFAGAFIAFRRYDLR